MKKKLFASLLSLILAISLMPVSALAAYPCGLTDGCTLEVGHDGACVLQDEQEEEEPNADDDGSVEDCSIDLALPARQIMSMEGEESLGATPDGELNIASDSIEGAVYLADNSETVEVVVAETGTLQATMEAMEGYAQENVISLDIYTEPGVFLNYKDFTYLRTELPNLRCLDLTDADCLNDYDPANPVEHEIPTVAMDGNSTLETIVLPTKVTSVGQAAFRYCTGLRGDLIIPDNITHLGKVAFGFYGSTYATLDSLTLSQNLEVMEAGAFLRCKINSKVTIPASVTYMGGDYTYGGVFQETGLAGIEFETGSRLEYIGSYCFNGNSNMEGALPRLDSLTYIGDYAFSACSNLTDVTFGENLVTIGASAFSSCSGLHGDLVIPDSVKRIEKNAFTKCYFDGTLTLGNSLEYIGQRAFQFNSFTGDLVIPDSVKEIIGLSFSYSGFDGATLTMGKNVEYIGGQAFREIHFTGDLILPDTLTSLGDSEYGAFYGCGFDGTLQLSRSLKWIPQQAFYNCKFTGKLVIPDSVETIGPMSFSSCVGFTGSLTIPDSVTEIGNNAFDGCSGLDGDIKLGTNITAIGDAAFRNTNFMGDIELPDGLQTLGANAFSACKNLTGDVTLPAGLETLGNSAFQSTNITALRYHGNKVTDWSNTNCLATLNALQTLDFSGSAVEKLTWKTKCATLTEVKLPDTLTDLQLTGKSALEDIDLTGCTALTNVDLSGNAIDFSNGKPKEWLNAYSGTRNIANQGIFLHAARGQTERSLGLNEAFEDDFKITTRNGTDLSTSDRWTDFLNAYQTNTDTTQNWVTANRLPQTFPITRTPNYTIDVDTRTAGVQTITYSCGYAVSCSDLTDKLNYQVTLTVGGSGGTTPEPSSTLTVVQANGTTISSSGLSKTYMDIPFELNAKIGTTYVDLHKVTWTICADDNGSEASGAVLKHNHEDGLFEITGAGIAWVTATYRDGTDSPLTSTPVKIVVNPRPYSLNLKQAKYKAYGAEDPVNFSYVTVGTGNGKTEELHGLSFTREAGEDVGKYQIYLYDPSELGVTETRNSAEFWTAYAAAAKAQFAQDNPNFTLNFGTNDGNLPAAGSPGNFTINGRPLGQNVRLNAKNYDGTADAQIHTATPVTNILGTDLESGVTVTIDARFDSADVKWNDAGGGAIAQDGEVTVTLTGPKVKNYTLPSGYTSGTEKNGVTWTVSGEGDVTVITMKRDGLSANINPLTVSCYIQPLDKVYDGTAAAGFESVEAFQQSFAGLCLADQKHIDTITAAFSDKNAGTNKTVTLSSDKINFKNYKMPAFTASITPKPLSVTGLTTADKVYDGTVAAVISGTPIIDMTDVLSGDDVSIFNDNKELKGEFYDKNVGDKKSVVVSAGFGLIGKDAGNYYLQPASTMYASITPATLTVTPNADQYKSLGALDPTFTYTLIGLMESDTDTETGAALSGVVRGALSRVSGEESGEYDFTLGSLTATSNYNLVLAEKAPKFVIRDTDVTLKAISVSDGTLSPTFNPEVESYTVKLTKGTTTVPTVTAEATNSATTVNVSKATSLDGSATITVTAADGQTAKTYTVSFSVAETVSVTASVVNASSGDSDGMIIATGAGGFGSYEFSLDNITWQSGNTFANKAAGSYTLYVRDTEDHSNTASTSVTVGTQSQVVQDVPAPTTLTADPTVPVIAYSADSLNIELTAGGVEGAVYRYYIYSGNGTINGNILTVTAPGSVTVRAEAIMDGFISAQAKTLTMNVTKADVVSMTATPKDVTTYGGTNGSITVTASGGLGTYQYRIGNGSWSVSGTFSGLTAGTYTVFVRDAEDHANITSDMVTITQANATDAAAINEVLSTLTLGDAFAVTESLALPASEDYGGKTVSISWSTSDPSVVSVDGTVTRPSSSAGNKAVTLTATLTCGGITRTKAFEVTVLAKAASSASSGSSSVSTTTTTTVKNADGSTTTTVKNRATGVVTETTKYADGSTLVVETRKDGTVTTTETTAERVVIKTVDAPGENVVASVTIPQSVGTAVVTVPTDADCGTVAVDAATGEIIKLSVPTEGGLTVKLDGSADLVLVDNSKTFDDTISHWAEEEINFVASRELFLGTAEGVFDPELPMTRAMLMTVLARLDGAETEGGETWYAKGMEWAVENGVSDGSNPQAPITREQLATMLYRYAGEPETEDAAVDFPDADAVSGYAERAVRWAVETGIIKGMDDGTLCPGGDATRAQVAAMIQRFCSVLVK